MDRSWVKLKNRTSDTYLQGIRSFLEFAYRDIGADDNIACPCKFCANLYTQSADVVFAHLVKPGIMPSYTNWYCHGESIYITRNRKAYMHEEFY
jgi:hypothetical protein